MITNQYEYTNLCMRSIAHFDSYIRTKIRNQTE